MNLLQSAHNPLVLGSNPSGPTNQTIETPAVQGTSQETRDRATGQLKLFSQLFEAEIPALGIVA
jgi:hypothetical protein